MKIISGLGKLSEVPALLSSMDGKRCLLVTGQSSYHASGAFVVHELLEQIGPVMRFSSFCTNPKIEDAIRGADIARNFKADYLFAIGGGSVLDMAKLIKAFLEAPGREAELARASINMSSPGLPLYCVPTTAGSGAEATHFAVVYDKKEKFSLASRHLSPNGVILDGLLTRSASSYQRACSGLDALAQAIESVWSLQSTHESRTLALSSIEALWEILPKVIAETVSDSDLQSAVEAAHLAGSAINTSKTTSAHAWSYGFTANFGIPHGHAVWLTLPEIFAIHLERIDTGQWGDDSNLSTHIYGAINAVCECLDLPSRTKASSTLREFVSSLGVEPFMERLGPESQKDRKILADAANLERMKNNPFVFSDADIARIFRL